MKNYLTAEERRILETAEITALEASERISRRDQWGDVSCGLAMLGYDIRQALQEDSIGTEEMAAILAEPDVIDLPF